MTAPALERRYRRLLACYPAEHRRTYGEEMIGRKPEPPHEQAVAA